MEELKGPDKSHKYESDENGFVSFGDVAWGELHQQVQYASRYVAGFEDYPNLGKGLRFTGDPSNYHGLRIHEDDIPEFVSRVLNYKKTLGNPFV